MTRALMATLVLASAVTVTMVAGVQTPATGYRGPRTPDGKPNLNGVWQAINTANWDLQAHNARPSRLPLASSVLVRYTLMAHSG